MTPTEVTTILRQFNEWRRDFDDKVEQPDTREITEAIDAAIGMIERLGQIESALSALVYALEERAIWNHTGIQRVVGCENGVYVRAKAALEK